MAALNMLWVNWRWGILLLCSVLFIGACGGSDSLESGSTKVVPTATAASATGGSASTATSAPQPTATAASAIGGSASTATSAPQPTATKASSGGGGGNLGLDDALDEAIELYEEFLEVLAGVTDEASARAAVDDVTRIVGEFEELDKRMDDYTEAEIASAALSSRFLNFGQELNLEMSRIFSDPAIFLLLAEAFENLN